MKLDAASLGNHEFDFGLDTLGKRIKESKFPWLNTNILNEKGELIPNTTKYFIREVPWAPVWHPEKRSTLKVCFFGVAYDFRESLLRDREMMRYQDAIETSKKEVEHLKKVEKCSVILPLTHQFSDDDCKLSAALGKDIDLILGGHDHSTEYTTTCGHAPLAKADSDLKTQWVMTLWLNDEGEVDSVDGRLLSLTDADPFDEEIHARVVEWERRGSEEMGKEIGCSKVELDSKAKHLRRGSTNLGNFITDAMRSVHKTDVALMNAGAIRGDQKFRKGRLTKMSATAWHPFGNGVAKIYATGKELKNMINGRLDCYHSFCGHLVQVSGLRYEYNPELPEGKRLVRLTTPDGKDIDEGKNFTVAINDFMLGTSPLKHNRLYNMVTLNDAMPVIQAVFDVIEEAGDKCIEPKLDSRIKVIS